MIGKGMAGPPNRKKFLHRAISELVPRLIREPPTTRLALSFPSHLSIRREGNRNNTRFIRMMPKITEDGRPPGFSRSYQSRTIDPDYLAANFSG